MPVSVGMALASTAIGVAGGTTALSGMIGSQLLVGVLGSTTFAMAAGHFLVSTALGAALNALTPKPKSGVDGGYSVNSKGGALNQQIIYGETKIGGVIVFDGTSGGNSKYLNRVVAFAGHEIDSYVDIYINDAKVSQLDSDGNVAEVELPNGDLSTRYNGRLNLHTHLGKTDQAADQNLIDAYAGEPEQLWTSSHRLRGIAYIYAQFKYNTEVYPNGVPTITAVIRGKKVYDPRVDNTVWSNNAALCLADYLQADYGVNDDFNNIDWDTITAAADVCDQTAADGTTRYTMNGAFTTSSTPYDFLSQGLTALGGLLWFSQGKWRLKASSWTTPVKSFDEDDLRGNINISTRHSRRDNFNAVSGIFRGPETNYVSSDYPEKTNHTATTTVVAATGMDIGDFYEILTLGSTDWNTAAGTTGKTYSVGDIIQCAVTGTGSGTVYTTYDFFLQVDNNQKSVLDLNLPFTDKSEACKRLARIYLERNRQQLTVDATFGLSMFGVQVGDNIQMTNERFGWANKTFEVIAWTFGASSSELLINCTLREISQEVFDDKDDGERYEKDNTVLPDPFFCQAPNSLSFDTVTEINSDGGTLSSIEFNWSHDNEESIDGYEIQWKRSTASNYRKNAILKEPEFELPVKKPGISFNWRVRAFNVLGVFSEWVYGGSATSVADTTTPNAPTNIGGQGKYNTATVTWDNPTNNTDGTALDDLKYINIYRQISGTYTIVAQSGATSGEGGSYTDGGLEPATSYLYKVSAIDYSGNESSLSGNVSITTLTDPSAGVGAVSVVPIYATDSSGSSQSFDPDPTGTDREYVNYYEYNTDDGKPTLPVSGLTFVKYVGTGQSIWPIYATNSSGNSPSLTQGTRTYVNWYEKVTTPVINTAGNTIDGVASSTFAWVLFEGPTGPQGNPGADGPAGSDGERGSGDWTIYVANLPVTSTEADTKFRNKTGLDPVENDLAKFTKNSDGYQSAWIYDNPNSGASGWVYYENVVDGNLLVEGSINARGKIASNTIDATLLVTDEAVITGTAQLGNAVITTANIGDLEVDTAKIAGFAVSIIESSIGGSGDKEIAFTNNSGTQAEIIVMAMFQDYHMPASNAAAGCRIFKGTSPSPTGELGSQIQTFTAGGPGDTESITINGTVVATTTQDAGLTRYYRSELEASDSGGALQNDLILFARFK